MCVWFPVCPAALLWFSLRERFAYPIPQLEVDAFVERFSRYVTGVRTNHQFIDDRGRRAFTWGIDRAPWLIPPPKKRGSIEGPPKSYRD